MEHKTPNYSHYGCTGALQGPNYFLHITLHKMFPVDLVTFTDEILNGKLHFLYSIIACFLLMYTGLTITDLCYARTKHPIFHNETTGNIPNV